MKAHSRTAKAVAICESARTPGNWKLSSWKRSTTSETSFVSSIGLISLKSSRGSTRAAVIKPRDTDPHPDCDRTNNARLRWRRGLRLIFGLAGKAESRLRFQREGQ